MSLDGEVSEKLRLVSPVTVDDGSYISKSGGSGVAGATGGGPPASATLGSDLKLSQLQVPGTSRRRKFSSQRSSTSSVGEKFKKISGLT